MNTEKLLSELSKPVAWPNGCNETAVNALRYLAEKPRPSYGNSMYNTEHLYMIAREVERMSSQHLYSQECVSALLAELEKKDREIAVIAMVTNDQVNDVADHWRDTLTESQTELEEKDRRLAELEASELNLIAERDRAEDIIAEMYEAATGNRPEWSNCFDFADAVEEVARVRAADRKCEGVRE